MNGDAGTALATVPTAPEHPSPLTSLGLADLYKLGKALTPTGFLPAAIKTPEQAMAVMLKGQELRVPPMYALSNIAVIQGKPACTAELLLALIYRDHGDDGVMFTEATNTQATISYKRRHWRERQSFTFTLKDAQTAGLSGGNWAKYPAAMLRARCISAVARMAFPDSIGGMYTPEELGAAVDAETGEILSAPAAPVEAAMEPEAVDARTKRLIARYDELVAEAEAIGLFPEALPKNPDEATLLRMGTALRDAIAAQQRTGVPA